VYSFNKKHLVFALISLLSINSNSNEYSGSPLDIIQDLEGVYKFQFANRIVTGEKYQSEDIIEIVKYSDDAIYFRVKLNFENEHRCNIYGIAKYDNGSFIYREKSSGLSQQVCTLKISTENNYLKLSDLNGDSGSTCISYCSARGSLSGYQTSLERKRKIRYMPIILKSVEYQSSVDEYNKK